MAYVELTSSGVRRHVDDRISTVRDIIVRQSTRLAGDLDIVT